MKKILTLLLVLTMLFSMGAVEVLGEDNIQEFEELKIIIDGENGEYEDVPLIINNRTMLPLRAVVTRIGITNDDEHIIWNGEEQSVTLIKDDTTVYLKIGSLTAEVNGEAVQLDVAPFVYKANNRTYVPARFVSEAFGKKVVWDGAQKGVIITDYEEYNKVLEVLEKTDQAMEGVTKFKTSMVYDIEYESGEDSMDLSMSINMDMDQEDYYMNMSAEVNLDPTTATADEMLAASLVASFMNMSSYKVGTTTYSKMFLTGDKWMMSEESQEDEEGLALSFEAEDKFYTSELSNEVIASSLRISESEDGLSYVLKGDAYQNDYIGSALGFVNAKGSDIKLNNFSLELVINKETYVNESISFYFDMETVDDDGSIIYSEITATITISEINGNFEIVVPEEVLNNLVDESGLFNFDSLTE